MMTCLLLEISTLTFFFEAEDGIRGADVTGVQTCALPVVQQRKEATLCTNCRCARRASVQKRKKWSLYCECLGARSAGDGILNRKCWTLSSEHNFGSCRTGIHNCERGTLCLECRL